MKKLFLPFSLVFSGALIAQGPAVTSWLQNNTITGTYYTAGNSTPIANNILVNCQEVEYSTNWVYVHTKGVPAYATGPFQDGNPSNATDQAAIYKISRNPVENTGTATATNAGNIGVFINGVSLFDYRDGVAWNPNTNALCGGPGNTACPGGPGATMAWNRDAIPAEMPGFDCAKGHPAMGNYHHHQNPSAFDLDVVVVSTVCNLYDADGLYVMNQNVHSPLIGYAYDGFPIYGAYAYTNVNGTGAITRMKSGYQLKADRGTGTVPSTTTWEMGYFREDYEFIANAADDYLDEHNGRFCITPEYPNGIYCYFATVDANHNSAYPYVVGPTFYGTVTGAKVTSVSETTTTYAATNSLTENDFEALDMVLFPNPASDLIAFQVKGLLENNLTLNLIDMTGKVVKTNSVNAGQSLSYFDVQDVYAGMYTVVVTDGANKRTFKVVLDK